MHRNISAAGRPLLFSAVGLLVVIADQLTKLWVRTHLTLGRTVPEDAFFHLSYGQNTGAVFGMFRGNNEVFIVLVIIEAVVILGYFFFFRPRYPSFDTLWNTVSLGLVTGALFGNLIDRINLGYVTDFIGVGPWPEFNIADASGVVGVIMFAFSLLMLSRDA